MKLPTIFYIIVYWLTAVIVNIIFNYIFEYFNFNMTWHFGFAATAILSFDFVFVYLISKKFSISLSASILLFLSIITVVLMMIFVWNKGENQTLLGQFVLNYLNLIFFLILLRLFWTRFKFEYLNHFIVLILFSLLSSFVYLILYHTFSHSRVDFKIIFVKQLAFMVPYPFIFKISESIMNTLEKNFTTPVERITRDDKKNGGA